MLMLALPMMMAPSAFISATLNESCGATRLVTEPDPPAMERPHAVGRRHASDVVRVLDDDRDPEQRVLHEVAPDLIRFASAWASARASG